MNIFELIRQIENIFTGLVHRFDFPMKGDASSQCEIKTNDIYFIYFFKLNKKKKKEKKKEAVKSITNLTSWNTDR